MEERDDKELIIKEIKKILWFRITYSQLVRRKLRTPIQLHTYPRTVTYACHWRDQTKSNNSLFFCLTCLSSRGKIVKWYTIVYGGRGFFYGFEQFLNFCSNMVYSGNNLQERHFALSLSYFHHSSCLQVRPFLFFFLNSFLFCLLHISIP